MRRFRRVRSRLRGSSDHPAGAPCSRDDVQAARDRLAEQERTVIDLLRWAKKSRQENDYAGRLRAAYAAEPRGHRT